MSSRTPHSHWGINHRCHLLYHAPSHLCHPSTKHHTCMIQGCNLDHGKLSSNGQTLQMSSLFFHGQELIGLWILYCNILQEISLTLWNLGKFKSSFVQNTENLGCTPDIQAFQGQKIWLLHQSLASRVADPGSTASPASIPSHVSNRWMVWNKQEAIHLSIEHCLWWPSDRQLSSLNLKEVYLPSLDTSHNTE